MARYVCSGAKLKCSMGSREADFGVMPTRRCLVRIEGNLVGTIMDHKPFVNIKSFGQCQSLANPTVAAATAANYGRLQKMPCVPNTTTPWIGGKMRVMISGEPTLLDSSKLLCMWAGMIEITNPGQNFVKEGAISLHGVDSAGTEKKAKGIENAGETEETESEEKDVKALTVKDFVEILEKIEKKQGYEAARHYAANDIDYWKINELAKRYVNEPDEDKKDAEKDNDPNQMPSRFMLLYGAEDDKLREYGCIDDHPDNFEGKPEHKICVEKLREGLILIGHNVEKIGPFDDKVYHAFLQYLRPYGRINLNNVYEDEDDSKKPIEEIADKYGVFSWKYFHEKCNGKVDHEHIIKELSAEYGDKLLSEKGADPEMYKPGISYHYMWAPYNITVEMDDEYKGGEVKIEIYDRNTMTLVKEDTVHG